MRVNLQAIAQAVGRDPRKALFDCAGPLTDYEIFHDQVLVATYIEPPRIMKGPSGEDVTFLLTDDTLKESRFQGKAGLVLKVGPLAFVDNSYGRFGGVTVERGDWVIYNPSDGLEVFIKDWTGELKSDGMSCRLFKDVNILGRVTDPALIY
jgi:hypothetical protein